MMAESAIKVDIADSKNRMKLPGKSVLVFMAVASGVFVIYYFTNRTNDIQSDTGKKSDLIWLQKILDDKKQKVKSHHRFSKFRPNGYHHGDDMYDHDAVYGVKSGDDDYWPDVSGPRIKWREPNKQNDINLPSKTFADNTLNHDKNFWPTDNRYNPDNLRGKSSQWKAWTDGRQSQPSSMDRFNNFHRFSDDMLNSKDVPGTDYFSDKSQDAEVGDTIYDTYDFTSESPMGKSTESITDEAPTWPTEPSSVKDFPKRNNNDRYKIQTSDANTQAIQRIWPFKVKGFRDEKSSLMEDHPSDMETSRTSTVRTIASQEFNKADKNRYNVADTKQEQEATSYTDTGLNSLKPNRRLSVNKFGRNGPELDRKSVNPNSIPETQAKGTVSKYINTNSKISKYKYGDIDRSPPLDTVPQTSLQTKTLQPGSKLLNSLNPNSRLSIDTFSRMKNQPSPDKPELNQMKENSSLNHEIDTLAGQKPVSNVEAADKDEIAELKKHIFYPRYMNAVNLNLITSKLRPECVPMQTISSFVHVCIHPVTEDPDVSARIKTQASWEFGSMRDVELAVLEYKDIGLIDLGAGIGEYSLAVASLKRYVVAVEPYQPHIELFHHSVERNKVENYITVLRNVISDNNEAFSMGHRPGHIHDVIFKPPSSKQISNHNYTKGITLDQLATVIPFKTAVLKVDIPGFTRKSLSHAEELFNTIDIKFVFTHWDNEDQSLKDFLVKFFKQHGYTASNQLHGSKLDYDDYMKWTYSSIVWEKTK